MTVKFKWYGDKVALKLNDRIAQRIDIAARTLRDHIREKLSRSQPTVMQGGRRESGSLQGRRTKKGLKPSVPGQYPKVVTGHLRRNVQSEFQRDEMKARVGTNVLYGKFLELGTRLMKRRPWLSRGVSETRGKIRRILAGKR